MVVSLLGRLALSIFKERDNKNVNSTLALALNLTRYIELKCGTYSARE